MLNKKIVTILLMGIMIFGVGGFASAATATNHGYNSQKSIGTHGIQNWIYNSGQAVNGVCVDAYHHIFSKTQKVTSGTPKTSTINKVKLLIVQNYLNIKSKTSGSNLAFAIWYFTDKVKSPNAAVTSMINKVKYSKTIIPDVYNQLISSKTTTKTNIANPIITYLGSSTSNPIITLISSTTSTPIITLINTAKTQSSTTNYIGNCSSSITEYCGCTKYLVTTTIMHYQNVTTTTITNTWNNQTTTNNKYSNQSTTTNLYSSTTNKNTITTTSDTYRTWNFNSLNNKPNQKIILFNTNLKTTSKTVTKPFQDISCYNTTTQNNNNYNTTTTNNKQYTTTCKTTNTTCFTKTIVTKTKICTPKPPCKDNNCKDNNKNKCNTKC